MKPIFVFFHVGDDVTLPSMLVDSIRWTQPNAQIVFCTDHLTPHIPLVDMRIEIAGDRNLLMTYRLRAFASARLSQPAMYLDTDMLVVRPLDPANLLNSGSIAMCRRTFNCDSPFNGNFKGLDFKEYDRRPLGYVYPYVACCTITPTSDTWSDLHDLLQTLHPKFHDWYGDQEALKRFAENRSKGIVELPETLYGCLPEQRDHLNDASIIHFKGPSRKARMRAFHTQLRTQLGG